MGLLDEIKKLARPFDDDEDYDDLDLEEEQPRRRDRDRRDRRPRPVPASDTRSSYDEVMESLNGGSSRPVSPVSPVTPVNTARRSTTDSKVVNINASTQMQVVIVNPDRFDSVSEIADHLRERHAVVLNLEATSKEVSRRLVDFLSGCAYALDGKITKVAVSTYIVTPYNVDIVEALLDVLGDSAYK